MNMSHIQNIYFLGIGGIGMSALARHFNSLGVSVCGYDKTPSGITGALKSEGIAISHDDDPATLMCNPDLVVYTPAIPSDSRLLSHFKQLGTPILKRSEVLGMLSGETPTIAVAGTHGKTTVCAMLTHIMLEAGIPVLSFMGGISVNYNTNYIGHRNPVWLIAEADEYDRSFLHLSPRIALITSIDSDHLDVYGNWEMVKEAFAQFAALPGDEGILIIKKGLDIRHQGRTRIVDYSVMPPADYHLEKIEFKQGRYHASMAGRISIDGIALQHPGRHNLENALAAAALAHQAGVGSTITRKALNSFAGVKRRFEIVLETEHSIFVDDYAHHPEEISACINTARELWPGKKITGVFQPHLYSRTRDLAEQFASSLSALDELMLLDIYPAREKPIAGVDAMMLLKKIEIAQAGHYTKEQLLRQLKENRPEVLITMGAGDIDRLSNDIKYLLIQPTHG